MKEKKISALEELKQNINKQMKGHNEWLDINNNFEEKEIKGTTNINTDLNYAKKETPSFSKYNNIRYTVAIDNKTKEKINWLKEKQAFNISKAFRNMIDEWFEKYK